MKLEKVAINDALPLKAARRDVIANLKILGVSGHRRVNFDGFIYSCNAATPYSAGTVIIASVYRRTVKTRRRILFSTSGTVLSS